MSKEKDEAAKDEQTKVDDVGFVDDLDPAFIAANEDFDDIEEDDVEVIEGSDEETADSADIKVPEEEGKVGEGIQNAADAEPQLTDAEIIADLRAEITRLSSREQNTTATPDGASTGTPGNDNADLTAINILDGFDFDEVLTNPATFNECLKTAVAAIITAQIPAIQVGAIEKMQLAIPTIVSTQVTHQQTLNEAAAKFYTAHQPLAQHKPLVASHITTVASEHPDWGLEQIMAEAATRSYKQLRLTATTNTEQRDTDKKPGAALRRPGKTGRVPSQTVDALQKELDELDGVNFISQF